MSTIKITELPPINSIHANAVNTILVGVDVANNITGKISLTTLAANLYSNNNLIFGSEKGIVYSPRVLTGAQTAITINFSKDSVVRATFNTALSINFLNSTTGKVVDVWLTNTAGNSQTITHGASAANSTTGLATVAIASQHSAKLQYLDIGGDVFVAITKA